jgi:hypothetical protein
MNHRTRVKWRKLQIINIHIGSYRRIRGPITSAEDARGQRNGLVGIIDEINQEAYGHFNSPFEHPVESREISINVEQRSIISMKDVLQTGILLPKSENWLTDTAIFSKKLISINVESLY